MVDSIGATNVWSDGPSGGQLLRELRIAAKLTLVDLALKLNDHEIRTDAAHLQRIETGRIQRPTAETVDAILTDGLDAPYRVRRDVLEAYGYRLPWALPDEREIEEGKRLATHELTDTTWPSILLDYAQRIWDWNRYAPRLLGLTPDDPTMARFEGITILDLAFNPDLGTS